MGDGKKLMSAFYTVDKICYSIKRSRKFISQQVIKLCITFEKKLKSRPVVKQFVLGFYSFLLCH